VGMDWVCDGYIVGVVLGPVDYLFAHFRVKKHFKQMLSFHGCCTASYMYIYIYTCTCPNTSKRIDTWPVGSTFELWVA